MLNNEKLPNFDKLSINRTQNKKGLHILFISSYKNKTFEYQNNVLIPRCLVLMSALLNVPGCQSMDKMPDRWLILSSLASV